MANTLQAIPYTDEVRSSRPQARNYTLFSYMENLKLISILWQGVESSSVGGAPDH